MPPKDRKVNSEEYYWRPLKTDEKGNHIKKITELEKTDLEKISEILRRIRSSLICEKDVSYFDLMELAELAYIDYDEKNKEQFVNYMLAVIDGFEIAILAMEH